MKEIQLTKGYVALVDDEDYEWLSKYKWGVSVSKYGYIRAKKGKTKSCKYQKMHRMILGITDPTIFVDHIDRNPLNNCRSNLRIATKGQNNMNVNSRKNSTSKFVGVHWDKARKRWRAAVVNNAKSFYVGRFKNEEDAALAYNERAILLHGEFANLNQIPKRETA
jgi:hypothetical protein